MIGLGDGYQDQLNSYLLKILKCFPPEEYEHIRFGGDYYYIIELIREIDSKGSFRIQQIYELIIKSKTIKKKSRVINNVKPLIKRLEAYNLIIENENGLYRLPKNGSNALGEFLGTLPYTRKGRSGLLRHITKSTKRLVLWYALCQPADIRLNDIKVQIRKLVKGSNEVKDKKAEGVQKILDRFITDRAGYLRRDSQTGAFRLANEMKVFDKLYSEYERFTAPRTTLRDPILGIVWQHGLLSGRMLVQELQELGVVPDRSSIYKQMKSLVRDGILEETEIIRKGSVTGQGLEKLYKVRFPDIIEHNDLLGKRIADTIHRHKFPINNSALKFLQALELQLPNALEIFYRELSWGFLLWDSEQTASIALWLDFIEGLKGNTQLFNKLKSVCSTASSREELTSRLKCLSEETGISSLAIVLMYFSLLSDTSISPKKAGER
jgi:DNA-binding PadR family transcriptional regulator